MWCSVHNSISVRICSARGNDDIRTGSSTQYHTSFLGDFRVCIRTRLLVRGHLLSMRSSAMRQGRTACCADTYAYAPIQHTHVAPIDSSVDTNKIRIRTRLYHTLSCTYSRAPGHINTRILYDYDKHDPVRRHTRTHTSSSSTTRTAHVRMRGYRFRPRELRRATVALNACRGSGDTLTRLEVDTHDHLCCC